MLAFHGSLQSESRFERISDPRTLIPLRILQSCKRSNDRKTFARQASATDSTKTPAPLKDLARRQHDSYYPPPQSER